jgi:hypothetical protein
MSADNNITLDQLRDYRKVWAEIDPNATKLIDMDKVPGFLSRLQPPLGCCGDDERLGRVLASLPASLSVINNKVHFRDLLVQLAVLFEKETLRQSGKNTTHVKVPSKKHIFGLKYKYISNSGDQTKFINMWTDVPVSVNLSERSKPNVCGGGMTLAGDIWADVSGSIVDETSLDVNLTTLGADVRVDDSGSLSEMDDSNLEDNGTAFVDIWRDVPDKYSEGDTEGDYFYLCGSKTNVVV